MTPAIVNLGEQKIITFDVWNTLIKANLEFSRLRTVEIARAYDIDLNEAKEAYTSIKFFLDQSAEIARHCMSTAQCWELLDATIQRFRRKNGEGLIDVDLKALRGRCDDLFVANPPIFTQDTKDLLVRLKTKGHYIGIISNTNFCTGTLLFDALFKDLGVFKEAVFSDLTRHPKPHGSMFTNIKRNLEEWVAFDNGADETDDYAPNLSAVHVGDNLICDGNAVLFGYDFQHCLNPDDLVATFKSVGL